MGNSLRLFLGLFLISLGLSLFAQDGPSAKENQGDLDSGRESLLQDASAPEAFKPSMEWPLEQGLLPKVDTKKDRIIRSLVAYAGIAGGGALSLYGASGSFKAILAQDLGAELHNGIALTLSGAVLLSIFSAILPREP